MPNYRPPVIPGTHEAAACRSEACAAQLERASETKVISKVMQRVQRQATGYYCGYTFKHQPVGKRFLRDAAESLNYLTTGMEDKSAGQRWHRITHRVLTEFQHRCMTRTAPEEWNLACNLHPHDVTNAEFIWTYRSVEFPGGQLVRRLEAERCSMELRECRNSLPGWLRLHSQLF